MKITNLSLTNFRNHQTFTHSFEGDVTVIVGPNGIGKTNIVEAIHYLSTAKSLRTRYDVEVISYDKDFSFVQGTIENDSDAYNLEIQIIRSQKYENVSSKKVKINKLAKRVNSLAGLFTSVLFTPEDIDILTKTPSIRRRYLDIVLSQTDVKYKTMISDYTKALRQRNKVLEMMREIPSYENQLGYWTDKILTIGKYIQDSRTILLKSLEKSLCARMESLDIGKKSIQIDYLISEINPERIHEYKLREKAAGRTLIGPHKDDFVVIVDDHDISRFGSRGQQRGIILGLKIAEIDFIEYVTKERPILLLDDIFSELDDGHRQAVMNILDKQQTIITSAIKRDILDKYPTITL